MPQEKDPTIIALPRVRLSFPCLFTAKSIEEGKEPQFSATFLERFWSKVNKTDSCWLWTAGTTSGYGCIRRSNNGCGCIGAHAASWIIHHGHIPEGLEVCHSCDVNYAPSDISYRRCVRPDHLWLGTIKQNIQDASEKGRMVQGEAHYYHKLTVPQVLEIRSLFEVGETNKAMLSRRFGVTRAIIRGIVNRRIWKHC